MKHWMNEKRKSFISVRTKNQMKLYLKREENWNREMIRKVKEKLKWNEKEKGILCKGKQLINLKKLEIEMFVLIYFHRTFLNNPS